MDPTKLYTLIDLNTQRDLIEPDGAWPVPGAEEMLGNVHRLLQCAQTQGIPLISTVTLCSGETQFPEGVPPHCMADTPGGEKVESTLLPDRLHLGAEKVDVPRPLPAQVILESVKGDPFKNPNAMAVLEQIYGRTAVIFGVTTEESVLQAVRGFRRHGLPCRVVRDAIRGRDPERVAQAERSVIETGALFVSTDDIIREIDLGPQSSAS